MNVRDRVSLTDGVGTHYGKITGRHNDGVCFVKWDSGITEKVHEAELTLVEDGAPQTAHEAAVGLLIPDEDVPEFEKAIEDQLLTAQVGAPPFENNEELPVVRGTPIDEEIPSITAEDWEEAETNDAAGERVDDPKFSWWERLWHRLSQ